MSAGSQASKAIHVDACYTRCSKTHSKHTATKRSRHSATQKTSTQHTKAWWRIVHALRLAPGRTAAAAAAAAAAVAAAVAAQQECTVLPCRMQSFGNLRKLPALLPTRMVSLRSSHTASHSARAEHGNAVHHVLPTQSLKRANSAGGG
jgi:hypothetical protein